MSVALDIAKIWKEETKQKKKTVAARHRRCISHFWSHKFFFFLSLHFFFQELRPKRKRNEISLCRK
jgi:hypothetical protein